MERTDSRLNPFEFCARFLAPFAFAAVLMTAVNLAVLESLGQQYPNVSRAYLRVCVSPMFAAVQEPLTSKLLPATVVVVWAARENRTMFIRANRYRLGALGGFTVGILEAGSKTVDALAFEMAVLPPVALHTVTGVLVGGAVYRLAGRKGGFTGAMAVLGAYAVGALLHFLWNSRVAFWLAGTSPC